MLGNMGLPIVFTKRRRKKMKKKTYIKTIRSFFYSVIVIAGSSLPVFAGEPMLDKEMAVITAKGETVAVNTVDTTTPGISNGSSAAGTAGDGTPPAPLVVADDGGEGDLTQTMEQTPTGVFLTEGQHQLGQGIVQNGTGDATDESYATLKLTDNVQQSVGAVNLINEVNSNVEAGTNLAAQINRDREPMISVGLQLTVGGSVDQKNTLNLEKDGGLLRNGWHTDSVESAKAKGKSGSIGVSVPGVVGVNLAGSTSRSRSSTSASTDFIALAAAKIIKNGPGNAKNASKQDLLLTHVVQQNARVINLVNAVGGEVGVATNVATITAGAATTLSQANIISLP
jgi:hypothetical protein